MPCFVVSVRSITPADPVAIEETSPAAPAPTGGVGEVLGGMSDGLLAGLSAEQLFARADVSGDGTIDRQEFESLHARIEAERAEMDRKLAEAQIVMNPPSATHSLSFISLSI